MRLLLVEDEPEVLRLLREVLEEAGWAVDEATGVAEALGLLEAFPYDLLVLDLALPDGDGLEVLRSVRRRRMPLPVLILTARDAPEARVLGLEQGADDYLVKPFYPQEVVARSSSPPAAKPGPGRELAAPGAPGAGHRGAPGLLAGPGGAAIRPRVRPPGSPGPAGEGFCPREYLVEKVWSGEESVDPRTVDTYIKYLRRKLAPDAIETVRGLGYRFLG